jgi:hypothetical protein
VLQTLYRGARWARAALIAAAVAAAAVAQASDVPYVPTPQNVVEKMLEMAKVGPADYLIDLGSGDGRIVITAARKYGARGFGVDLNPVRIDEANENARKAGVTDKVAFYQRNLFDTDLSQATVITMYLLPRVNLELRPRLLELKPGTRLVSHDFSMDDWKPDAHVRIDAKDKYGGSGGTSDIYFWVVPAKVAGGWQWQLPLRGRSVAYEITLEQKFQVVSGTARVGGRSVRLQNPRLHGDEIRFSFSAEIDGSPVRHEFSGRVDGGVISGTASLSGPRLQSQLEWNAQRVQRAASAAAAR